MVFCGSLLSEGQTTSNASDDISSKIHFSKTLTGVPNLLLSLKPFAETAMMELFIKWSIISQDNDILRKNKKSWIHLNLISDFVHSTFSYFPRKLRACRIFYPGAIIQNSPANVWLPKSSHWRPVANLPNNDVSWQSSVSISFDVPEAPFAHYLSEILITQTDLGAPWKSSRSLSLGQVPNLGDQFGYWVPGIVDKEPLSPGGGIKMST